MRRPCPCCNNEHWDGTVNPGMMIFGRDLDYIKRLIDEDMQRNYRKELSKMGPLMV